MSVLWLKWSIDTILLSRRMASFTRRQWLTLIVISIADFCNAICVSLQAPFYPQEVSSFFANNPDAKYVINHLLIVTLFIVLPSTREYVYWTLNNFFLKSGSMLGWKKIGLIIADKSNNSRNGSRDLRYFTLIGTFLLFDRDEIIAYSYRYWLLLAWLRNYTWLSTRLLVMVR